jgi:hypothetical protein
MRGFFATLRMTNRLGEVKKSKQLQLQTQLPCGNDQKNNSDKGKLKSRMLGEGGDWGVGWVRLGEDG